MAGISIGTSTYSGEVLEDLISHSVKGNDTVDNGLAHIKAGIQHKYVLPTIKLGDIIQDNKPTPVASDSQGTYTVGERYLEPGDFMVYLQFNPRDFEAFWKPFQPDGPLEFRALDPMVQAKMLRLLIAKKDEYMGTAIWMSTKGGGVGSSTTPAGQSALGTGNYKYWSGVMDRLLTSVKNDPAGEKVIQVGTTALDTGEKIEAALYAIYKACPNQIRSSKKLKFIMDMEMWDVYDSYLTSKDSKYTENKDINERRFKGKQIIPINGMPAQTIVLAELTTDMQSNLWLGVDFQNDGDIVKVERLQANSEEYFFQMRMKLDTNIVRPGEIAMHSVYTPSV